MKVDVEFLKKIAEHADPNSKVTLDQLIAAAENESGFPRQHKKGYTKHLPAICPRVSNSFRWQAKNAW